MNTRSLTTKLITILLLLAVLAYFGVQAWNYFTAAETVSTVYAYRAEQVLALSGFTVRDEQVVDCSEPLVDLTRAEGERVGKGRRIATVYQSADALEAERQAEALNDQLEQLRFAQSAARNAEAALRLETEIERGIVALRAALARGDYAAGETASSALETMVLRREYTYRGGDGLDERIAALEAQIAEAQRSAGGGTRAVEAPFAGTYSAAADGYEAVLTPAALETMTPGEFARVAPEPVSSTVGRMIRGETWYYAAAVASGDAAELTEGRQLELAISGVDRTLPVTVHRISGEENGKRLLVLRAQSYLSAVTMLRDQSAELILESRDGLRIPKNALRIGEDGRAGVYCRIGRQAWFKPVDLLYQGEDYCLVVPGEIDAVRESDYIFYTLRAGDEALVTAQELYNGKVLEQT